ncbi:MAG: LytTR family DNA-binding domain-containing protein [Bacteroidota bacterium]
MNCIIIEDEPLALNILQSYVEKVPNLKLEETFRDALKAWEYLQQNDIDLLFLDINMPDLSGIQLLKALPNPPMVIFTTAYAQYAIESYNLEAVDYLLKPIEFDRFLKAVQKASKRKRKEYDLFVDKELIWKNQSTDLFFVKSGVKNFKVKLSNILYIEAADNYVKYALKDQKILSLDSLSNLETILPSDQFIRVHRSYLIAIAHIDILQKEFITIAKQRIPLGRTFRTQFFERIERLSS